MCDEFERVTEELTGEKISAKPVEQILEKIEQNRYVGARAESLIAYQLTLAHFLILKRKFADAFLILRDKVATSSIVTGRPTVYYYETR